jgi:hypothetical protein
MSCYCFYYDFPLLLCLNFDSHYRSASSRTQSNLNGISPHLLRLVSSRGIRALALFLAQFINQRTRGSIPT